MMKKKTGLTVAMSVAVVGLLSASGFLAYRSVTTPSGLFELETGKGAQSMTSLDQYLAVLSLIGAVAILGFMKKFWASR